MKSITFKRSPKDEEGFAYSYRGVIFPTNLMSSVITNFSYAGYKDIYRSDRICFINKGSGNEITLEHGMVVLAKVTVKKGLKHPFMKVGIQHTPFAFIGNKESPQTFIKSRTRSILLFGDKSDLRTINLINRFFGTEGDAIMNVGVKYYNLKK